jgi:hypothetical protein
MPSEADSESKKPAPKPKQESKAATKCQREMRMSQQGWSRKKGEMDGCFVVYSSLLMSYLCLIHRSFNPFDSKTEFYADDSSDAQ